MAVPSTTDRDDLMRRVRATLDRLAAELPAGPPDQVCAAIATLAALPPVGCQLDSIPNHIADLPAPRRAAVLDALLDHARGCAAQVAAELRFLVMLADPDRTTAETVTAAANVFAARPVVLWWRRNLLAILSGRSKEDRAAAAATFATRGRVVPVPAVAECTSMGTDNAELLALALRVDPAGAATLVAEPFAAELARREQVDSAWLSAALVALRRTGRDPSPALVAVAKRLTHPNQPWPVKGYVDWVVDGDPDGATLLAEQPFPDLVPNAGAAWADQAQADLTTLPPEWTDLVRHARSLTTAKPGRRWAARARTLLTEIGDDRYRDLATGWLRLVDRPRTMPLRPHHPWTPVNDLIDEPNADTLRGLLWMLMEACTTGPATPTPATMDAVTRVASTAATMLPGHGARSPKLANAAIATLAALGARDHLRRLAVEVTFKPALKAIDAALCGQAC